MDLDKVKVWFEPVDPEIDLEAWVTDIDDYDPYDEHSGILKTFLRATLTTEEGEENIGCAEVWIIMRDKMALKTFFDQIYNVSTRGSYMIDYLFDEWTSEYTADRTGLENVDLDDGTIIWLEYIHVAEDHRGQGVMRKMLFEAQRQIQELVDSCFMVSYSTMYIDDHDVYHLHDGGDDDELLPLFQSLGFQRVRRTPYLIRGPELVDDEAPSLAANRGSPDGCVRTLFTT